ncbi:hypothetical protein, variant [Phytophthora nicotianae CJ01A1]|uniref:Uncharacterized protein n=8 Tax=Phytophthora nicotianae TaxID=4792 RepID=V9F3D4_PHYNI|nr:hypothetical protein, variant [Phytophthora nicotianae P1569]ETL39406.1 hypothetical protein, variant [Phytophthora nicotianae]ETL92529.1 hypothetical protein, variant [Phytophthora nicotianae]ETM45828.1 hypothetical protein, variant [Phytophthora nicotianae]ETP15835.1 hypothetical protein, variant [Phytophthora nicotianae CJ01A1]
MAVGAEQERPGLTSGQATVAGRIVHVCSWRGCKKVPKNKGGDGIRVCSKQGCKRAVHVACTAVLLSELGPTTRSTRLLADSRRLCWTLRMRRSPRKRSHCCILERNRRTSQVLVDFGNINNRPIKEIDRVHKINAFDTKAQRTREVSNLTSTINILKAMLRLMRTTSTRPVCCAKK